MDAIRTGGAWGSNLSIQRVSRTDVWGTSWRQLLNIPIYLIRNGFGFDGIGYIGEQAYGGGLTREWFTLMSTAISRGLSQLFENRPDTVFDEIVSGGDNRVDEYRAVGRFFALSIIEGIPLGLNLHTAFYKLLLHQPLRFEDLRGLLDDASYRSIEYCMDPSRTEEELAALMSPLAGSGSADDVTLANRQAQLEAVIANVPVNHSPQKFAQILAGFNEVIPHNLLSNWTPEALANLIKGNDDIDIDDLEHNLIIGYGYSRSSDQIQWLLTVLREYDQPMRRAFLRFVTGSSVLPSGGFAQSRLSFDHTLRRNIRGDVVLPTTHTCFRTIDLPEYASLEELRRMVTLAVEADAGGEMQG